MKTKRILFMLFFLTSFFLIAQNRYFQNYSKDSDLYNPDVKIEGDSLLVDVYSKNIVIFETKDTSIKYTQAIMYYPSSNNIDIIEKRKATRTGYVTQTDSLIVMTQLDQVLPNARITYYTFVQAKDTMELQCIVRDPYSYQYYKNLEFKKGSYVVQTFPDLDKKTALKNILYNTTLWKIGTYNYQVGTSSLMIKKPLRDCPFLVVDLQDSTQTIWKKVDKFDSRGLLGSRAGWLAIPSKE